MPSNLYFLIYRCPSCAEVNGDNVGKMIRDCSNCISDCPERISVVSAIHLINEGRIKMAEEILSEVRYRAGGDESGEWVYLDHI
jgi:hypothetical protein